MAEHFTQNNALLAHIFLGEDPCGLVELLMLAGETELDALTVACELVLEGDMVSAPIVMNELRRLVTPNLRMMAINVPDRIALTMESLVNCQRYDYLLGASNVH